MANKKYAGRERLDKPAYEIGANCGNPSGTQVPEYVPTEEEIATTCTRLQSNWTEAEKLVRKHNAAYRRAKGTEEVDTSLMYSVPQTKVLI